MPKASDSDCSQAYNFTADLPLRAARLLASLMMPAALSGCAVGADPADAAGRDAIPVQSLPGWAQDKVEELRPALRRQCALRAPPAPWPALCQELSAHNDLRVWIEKRFVAWPLIDEKGRNTGLITGYHEPLVTGSLVREASSQVALHELPSALKAQPSGGQRPRRWFTRTDIETGQAGELQPLVWLDDPVEAFFLQVQGSARVRLRDGSQMRVGYAGHNGHTYRSIGRELIDRGALTREEATAPGIKTWLRANPQEAVGVMRSNPRYVFFRRLDTRADDGPPGSLGVPLTPGRSLATDKRRVPPGALMFLETPDPGTRRTLRRAVVNQDTGGAIVGAIRADLFWGSGDQAALKAGLMRDPGRLWVLWPVGEEPPASIRPAPAR
jgi:membrane-bound lytic murein transglycosylase A